MDNNQLYQKLDEEIQSVINNYPVHEWTLHDMELYVDNMVEKYGDQFISQQSINALPAPDMLMQQQNWGGDDRWGRNDPWGRDQRWDRDQRCGRNQCRGRDRGWNGGSACRDCDFRDYVRLGILRNVFDCRWC